MNEDQQMFVRNAWYVAGWSDEFEKGQIASRTLLNEPVALYRKEDGSLVAVEGRCPHRWAAMALGRIEGDDIRCMYHGLKFSPDGVCVEVPGGERPNKNLCLRSYPIVERYRWAWIWMGEPENADPDLIPVADMLDQDHRRIYTGQLDYKAAAPLICDNLLDLSHVAFVHGTTLGRPQEGDTDDPAKRTATGSLAKTIDRGVRSQFWRRNAASRRVYQGGDSPIGDIWHRADFMVPGIFLTEITIYPLGTADACDDGPPGAEHAPLRSQRTCQAVTPLTTGSSRYFYSFGPQLTDMSEEAADGVWQVLLEAFGEDRAMIEAQHEMIENHPGRRMWSIGADRGPGMFRVTMDRLMAAEKEVPKSSAFEIGGQESASENLIS